MKNLILVGFVFLMSIPVFAQDTEVIKEEFYSNGNLKTQFVSLENDLIGATYYFESGEVYETGFFKEDKLTGKWTTYTLNSDVQAIGYFTDSKKSGTWTTYKDGEVISEISYSQNLAEKKQ